MPALTYACGGFVLHLCSNLSMKAVILERFHGHKALYMPLQDTLLQLQLLQEGVHRLLPVLLVSPGPQVSLRLIAVVLHDWL